MMVEGEAEPGQQKLQSLPFAVQLRNIFAVEIVAKRFPTSGNVTLSTHINIEDVQIDDEHLQALAMLSVRVECIDEPCPFEISFKLLGEFAYTRDYSAEMVQQFLLQGSLSIMLPFAREQLLNLCTRLQIPPLILQMVQVAPLSMAETAKEDTQK